MFFKDHLAEYNIKVRFLFFFFGPDRPNIDYHEIGRCMGTLMTNREYHDVAYGAKNRAQLLKGITTFTNRNLCLVLPIGEYDDDVLAPAMIWINRMVNKKITKIVQGGASKKSVTKAITAGVESGAHGEDETTEKSSKETKKSRLMSIFGEQPGVHEEFDPFKRTGCPFGSLIKEIQYRYSKYWSDIYDGLNLHCFIAIVFIFTVCFAPALCFGGILGKFTSLKITENTS